MVESIARIEAFARQSQALNPHSTNAPDQKPNHTKKLVNNKDQRLWTANIDRLVTIAFHNR